MKKLLTGLFLLFSLTATSCWVELPYDYYTYNEIYIHSVNNKHLHYLGSDRYAHNYSVDLPITVQIQAKKLTELRDVQNIELQYKIERYDDVKKKYFTVKDFTTVKKLTTRKIYGKNEVETKVLNYGIGIINWKLDFSKPVNLFGRNGIIDIPKSKIQKGDVIIIRIYLDNYMYENFDTSKVFSAADIDKRIVNNTNYERYNNINNNFYQLTKSVSPVHYFKVIYSGKRRPII